MDPNVEVIVLSDDDDDDTDSDHTGALDSSAVLIVEQNDDSKGVPVISEILDEDVTITFSRKANVLPHARFDCTKAFSFTDSGVSGPEGRNEEYCEQCFCYICDQVASQCTFWTIPGFCHCNAHKRSIYWKSLRDKRIMGCLHELKFPFNPADLDSDLQRAESSLQGFACNLALKYSAFLVTMMNPNRRAACVCPCHSHLTNSKAAQTSSTNGSIVGCSRCYAEHQKLMLDDYRPVLGCVCAFFNGAIKESPKTASVMVLGAVKLFLSHIAPGSVHALAISHVMMEMFWRALSVVQSLFVEADLPTSFVKHLQDFLQILPLPPDWRKFRNSLNVLSWNDSLLSAVLRGQNVNGVRYVKGRRPETLHEAAPVVRTRVLKLQQQNRFRELARYLKVVKCDDSPILQMMRDWIPFYLCKVGDYSGAINSLFSHAHGSSNPASRLSPAQFGAYLRIFLSGHTPSGIPHPPRVEFVPSQDVHMIQTDPLLSSTWTPVEGGYKLQKRQEVLRFALRVMNCNSAVFAHADSWVKLLNFANQSFPPSPSSYAVCTPEPDYNFLIRSRDIAVGILSELNHTSQVQIPKDFQGGYSEQALLLLAAQALAWRLFHSPLKPVLSVILTLKSNPWVMRWLFGSLVVKPQVLQDLLCVILEELLPGQSKSASPLQDVDDQLFIATFLCLFFMEPSVYLQASVYPVSYLLAQWNEFENPWQFHLRRMLEVNESSLSGDKQQVVFHMIQWSLHQ